MSTPAERGYRTAQLLCAQNGRTFHLASRLLPRTNRRAVHALYGFARIADDIVDTPIPGTDDRLDRLAALFANLAAARAGDRLDSHLSSDTADLLVAVADSAHRFDMSPAYFAAFERSMRMDLPAAPEFTARYRDVAHLREYTYGSAAVIGLLLVPLLGADARTPITTAGATRLGEAFQLTNFLRDVGEDLERDRIYLPAAELRAFGVDEAHLRDCHGRRRVSPPLRRALAHLVAVNRDWYRRAQPGIEALPRRTRPAIRAAAHSYADILRVIAANDYEVFAGRAVVPAQARAAHAVAALF
ncbi:phytoene/squalene synthase family protein [Gordonia defluvii]|uniref:Phytoene/squalene synthase family protein n=1 Tax=Gordonia defluvii TaxID=283718 RepID=A0ABP6LFC4_9ACTN